MLERTVDMQITGHRRAYLAKYKVLYNCVLQSVLKQVLVALVTNYIRSTQILLYSQCKDRFSNLIN